MGSGGPRGSELSLDSARIDECELPEVTRWLASWADGDAVARDRLVEWAYPAARAIAARRLAGRRDPDVSTTQLTHDALLRLLDRPVLYAHRGHFLKVFAMAVRQELVDHIRRVRSEKRGGDAEIVTEGKADQVAVDLVDRYDALHEALAALERRDARKCRVIEMHYFLGFERGDIARLLEVSIPTVDRDLAFARAWLKAELADTPG